MGGGSKRPLLASSPRGYSLYPLCGWVLIPVHRFPPVDWTLPVPWGVCVRGARAVGQFCGVAGVAGGRQFDRARWNLWWDIWGQNTAASERQMNKPLPQPPSPNHWPNHPRAAPRTQTTKPGLALAPQAPSAPPPRAAGRYRAIIRQQPCSIGPRPRTPPPRSPPTSLVMDRECLAGTRWRAGARDRPLASAPNPEVESVAKPEPSDTVSND